MVYGSKFTASWNPPLRAVDLEEPTVDTLLFIIPLTFFGMLKGYVLDSITHSWTITTSLTVSISI